MELLLFDENVQGFNYCRFSDYSKTSFFFLISGISLWIILLYRQWLLVFSKVLFRVFHFCQKNLVIFSTCHSESKAQVVIVTRLLFSSSVVSDSLWPHGLQHARLPCPSLSPGVWSNSCLLNWWCHPTISSFVVPFSPCLQSLPASRSLPVSRLFTSGGQRIEASAMFRADFL